MKASPAMVAASRWSDMGLDPTDRPVLVTGASGYIGSHTVRMLRQRQYRVVAMDLREPRDEGSHGVVPFVVGDIADAAKTGEVLRRHDVWAVIHLAAWKSVPESLEYPARYFQNNVAAGVALLEAMDAAGVRALVFSSSCAVYGTPTALPITETSPLHPENPYGESKLLFERILRWFDACHQFRHVSLRYFNAAGAWPDAGLGEDDAEATSLIPTVMRSVSRGAAAPLRIFGSDYDTPDGTPVRDYVHVLDLAAGHVAALEYLARGGTSELINLGSGRGTSVMEIVRMVESVTGRAVPTEMASRRSGDPAAVWADNEKAARILGWRPSYGLREILESAWAWQARHDG